MHWMKDERLGGGGLKSIRWRGGEMGIRGFWGVWAVYNWRAALSSDAQSTSKECSGILTGISMAIPLSPLGLY